MNVIVHSSRRTTLEEVKVPSSREALEKWPYNISNICELQSSIRAITKEVEVPSSREAPEEWLDNMSNLNIKKGLQKANIESTMKDHEK